MNLLIFVLSLIMVLSAMSYARLESFLKSRFHAEEWRWIVKESERDLYNRQRAICNENVSKNALLPSSQIPPEVNPEVTPEVNPEVNPETPLETPEEKDQKDKAKKPFSTPGSGQISLSWFLKKDFREKEPALFQKVQEIAEQLVRDAWGDQPFFKILEKERPSFIKELWQEVMDVAEKAKESNSKLKVTSLDSLIYFPWNDLQLKTAFGRMLQEGLIYTRQDQEQELEMPSHLSYGSPKGFQSLKDFFTSREETKIRVWLAPRILLRTLFPDPGVLNELIKTREAYYKELKKEEGPTAEELSERFKEAFESKTPFPELLDFKVTTTNIKGR